MTKTLAFSFHHGKHSVCYGYCQDCISPEDVRVYWLFMSSFKVVYFSSNELNYWSQKRGEHELVEYKSESQDEMFKEHEYLKEQ